MAAIGDVIEASLTWYAQDQIGLIVRHYRITNITGAGATDQKAVDDLEASFHAACVGVVGPQVFWRGIQAQRIRPQPPTLRVFSTPAATAGTFGTIVLPRQVAGLIRLGTATAGKSYRGRAYVPFPSIEADAPLGLVTAAYRAVLQPLAVRLASVVIVGVGGNTAELTPVVLSRKLNVNTPIVKALDSAFFATQRRRGSYGRTNTLPW